MTEIINFILTNYVWILVIVLLMLLAIIGSIAEKSFFKNPNNDEKKEEEQIDLTNKKMSDIFGDNNTLNKEDNIESQNTNQINSANEVSTISVDNPKDVQNPTVNVQNKEIISNAKLMSNLEDKLEKLDVRINEALPKRDTLDDYMLDDVDDLSIDINNIGKSKKGTTDFDDIELPNIDSKKKNKKDLWKK